jgi:type IV pilus assembly protein PilC
MPLYKYKAISKTGEILQGSLPAMSEADLENKLKQSNLDLINCSLTHTNVITNLFGQISLKEIVFICIHFHHLEKAGVPLLDSIGDLRDMSENPLVKQVMVDIYDSLKNGESFSTALSKHPKIFDNVFVSLIRAGEKTGAFSSIFSHLENHFKWVLILRQKIIKAISYPIFLLLLMCVVIGLMMTFVIPKLTVFLLGLNIKLPFYSVLLIAISNIISTYWYIIVSFPILIYSSIRLGCYLSYDFAFKIDELKLKVPVIGNIIKKIEISRFCHFFAITYRSGIKILECVDVSANIVKNKSIRTAIEVMKKEVTDGKNLTEALTATGQFPNMVIRMFKIGEETGNIDQSLEHITEFYDNEVNIAIDNLVGVLQPALTILMGGLMFWITMAVFGPIYSNFGNITSPGGPAG